MKNLKCILLLAFLVTASLTLASCGSGLSDPAATSGDSSGGGTPTHYKIYVTNTSYEPGVDFTSVAGADTICMNDANKPDGSTYKALLGNSTTRQVGGADWPLKPNTVYYKSDGVTVIGTTTGTAIFTTLSAAIGPPSGIVWTGLGTDMTTDSNNCSDWTGTGNGAVGYSTQANVNAWNDTGITLSCNENNYLYCVQQ